MKLLAAITFTAMIWAGALWINIWALNRGSPQHVWFFCDQLGWCAPKYPPYCPPDPRECQ